MLEKRLYAFRAAICTKDNEEQIIEDVKKIYCSVIEKNGICPDDIVAIEFTTTPDITALNPATALRRSGVDVGSAALFCALEAVFKGSLPSVIRMMLMAYVEPKGEGKFSPQNVYLNGAEVLRPDLSK